MGKIFDQMTRFSMLLEAFDRVEENQGCAGVDGISIEDFARNLDGELRRLSRELMDDTYRSSPLLRTHMEKEDGGLRPLSIPTVRDRVAHTAAALVLTPVLEREFEACSFAYRPGRSVNAAVRRVLALRDAGYRWVVDADIDEYFSEIPHAPLLEILKEHVEDRRMLRLIGRWLRAEVREGNETWVMEKGVAQGSPLSPLLSNLYLDAFDEDLEHGGHKLIRYADDFVVLCRSRPSAQAALELTRESLDDLSLELNEGETDITHFDTGFRFLGVQFLRGLAFRPIEPGPSEHLPAQVEERSVSQKHRDKIDDVPQTRFGKALAAALRRTEAEPSSSSSTEVMEEAPEAPVREPPAESPRAPTYDPVLRTLHIIEQGAEVSKKSRRLRVIKDDRLLAEVPALKVDQIIVFGNVQLTTAALRLCMRHDIPVYFLSRGGRLYGLVDPMTARQASLHRQQFICAEDGDFRLSVSRAMVAGKLANCRTLIMRVNRRRRSSALARTADSLARSLSSIDEAASLDTLRGVEGSGAAAYFGAWRRVLETEWGFKGRQRRPPPDPVNCLLSYAYTLLFSNVLSLVAAQGLMPHIGFYHDLRRGHSALVSDLMEEFRAPVADSAVLALLRRPNIRPDDFERSEDRDQPVLIPRSIRKRLIQALESALSREIRHPDAANPCDYRRVISFQVRRLKECVQRQAPNYQPFLTR